METNNQAGWSPTRLACGHEVVDPQQIHYCDYLSLNTLDKLNDPYAMHDRHRASIHPDESQFVAVHQMCELAFGHLIRELRRLILELHPDTLNIPKAILIINRLVKWMNLATHAIHPLHTMLPDDFKCFRDFLTPASGLESSNFRRIELLSGISPDRTFEMPFGPSRSHHVTYRQLLDRPIGSNDGQPRSRLWIEPEFDQLAARPTVSKCFSNLLMQEQTTERELYTWFETYQDSKNRESPDTPQEERKLQLKKLADALYQYDQSMHTHRLEHIRIVQKQLDENTLVGTGGTSGIPYLKVIADQSWFFPNLVRIKKSQT